MPETLIVNDSPSFLVDNITKAIRRRDSVRLSVRQIARESDH